MKEKITHLFDWLKSLPVWSRIVVLVIFAILAFIISSCGTQKVVVRVKDTPTGVSISTTQSSADSSGTTVNVNPNITIPLK